jgi:hypothetical protein
MPAGSRHHCTNRHWALASTRKHKCASFVLLCWQRLLYSYHCTSGPWVLLLCRCQKAQARHLCSPMLAEAIILGSWKPTPLHKWTLCSATQQVPEGTAHRLCSPRLQWLLGSPCPCISMPQDLCCPVGTRRHKPSLLPHRHHQLATQCWEPTATCARALHAPNFAILPVLAT